MSRFFLPIVALVAAVALVVSTYAVVTQPSIASLRRELTIVHTELSAQTAAAGNVATLQGQINGLVTTLHQYKVCVPQLQHEIDGLNVSTYSSNGWLTSAYIQNPTIVSSDCSRMLTGSTS